MRDLLWPGSLCKTGVASEQAFWGEGGSNPATGLEKGALSGSLLELFVGSGQVCFSLPSSVWEPYHTSHDKNAQKLTPGKKPSS